MSQEGFDTLMHLTESRYRLSMVVARRAAQLKIGIPSVLPKDEVPRTRNTVTIAMKELEEGAGVVWGSDLPNSEELRHAFERERREETVSYSVSRRSFDDEGDDA
jgi:DNA-directed RNA polymerase subunit omega